MKRKLLAGVLSLCMIFSLIPVGAFAAFDDTNGHWGAASAERWSQVGVLNGDDAGNFNPDKQMTRAEFAQMLCNLMGYTEKAPNNFSDVPNDAWYADAILKLVAAGVMNGVSDTSAAPQAPITREQAAVLLCRAMNITPSANASVTFSDAGSVSSWAKDAVAALTERGMINGVGNNNFAPANNIVRAAVAQMVDNMVAEYVTQSGATVTGEVKGVVIIKADNVKIEDATLAENVIVAPAAENATVTLTGSTQAAGVVVGAEGAKVVVDSTATAESVTVDAPKAQTEIAGKVDTVAVTENAESAKTTVAKDAEVKTVTVDAPKAETQVSGKVDTVAVAQNAESAKTTVAKDAEVTNVTVAAPKADTSISGTVSKVDVAQSATGANVTANAGAKVDSVTTAANDVKVNGADNTIGTVTTTGGTADVTSKGTEVKNEGADKVTVDGNKDVPKGDSTTSDKTPTTPSGGGSSGGSSGGNQPTPADVVKAPIEDHPTDPANKIPTDKLGDVEVNGTLSKAATDSTPAEYNVTITGRNIMNHDNTNHDAGHWVGFGMPVAPTGSTYSYYVDDSQTATSSIADRTTPDGKYNTVYFTYDTEAAFKAATRKITVKNGSDVVAIYNVSFNVTFWKANVNIRPVNDTTNAGDFAQTFVKDAVSGITVTPNARNGENIPVTMAGENKDSTKLVEYTPTSGSDNGNKGYYSYYNMTIDPVSGVTLKLNNGGEGYGSGIEINGAMNLCQATKLFDGTYASVNPTHTYVVKDAAGRTQDTFKVVITNNVTLAGATSLTVNFKDTQGKNFDSTTLNWVGDDATAKNVTFPVLENGNNVGGTYYTGKWTDAAGHDVTLNGNVLNSVAKPGTSDPKSVTYTAESVVITKTVLSCRANGPENGHTPAVETFPYKNAYDAAGITIADNTGAISIDTGKMITFVNSAYANGDLDKATANSNGYYLYHIYGHGDLKGTQIMAGVAYGHGVTGKTAKTLKYASSVNGLASASDKAVVDLTSDVRCHEGVLISYIPVATVANTTHAIEFAASGLADSDFCLWLDANDKVIAVTKTEVNITKTAVPNVTVKVAGNSTGSVQVPYNTAIGAEKLNAIKDLAAKTDYVVTKIKNGGTEVTENTKFTANVNNLTAEYESAATIVGLTQSQIGSVLTNGWANGLSAKDMVITLNPKSGDPHTLVAAQTTLDRFVYSGFSATTDARGYVVIAVKKPTNTTINTNDIVVRAGVEGTDAYQVKLAQMDSTISGLTGDYVVMPMVVAAKDADKATDFKVWVNWNGMTGNERNGATEYTIDLSSVAFKAASTN